MKKNNSISISILIGTALILIGTALLAYDDKTTHPDLAREIISFYELATGKKFSDEQKQWIIQGSIDEDFAPRWLNHFYDPTLGTGLSATALGFGYAGYPSKNWAQFSSYQTLTPSNIANLWTGNGPVISGSWFGDFSYEAAIKSYSKNKEKDAYLALGHILHLIEDITVPEHTRNDIHPGGDIPSFYENWTKQNSEALTKDLGERLFNQGNRPVIYGDLGAYFDNLAGYTNSHFFSPRTANYTFYQKPKIAYEDGTFAYGYDERGILFDLAIIETDIKSSNKKYLLKDDNYQVMKEYWTRLSRQAVMNGAGVISLFLNQGEAARKVELAKQKVDENSANTQNQTFTGFLAGLFTTSSDTGVQPAMTIISESSAPAPTVPVPVPTQGAVVMDNGDSAQSASNIGTGTPTPAPALTPETATPATPLIESAKKTGLPNTAPAQQQSSGGGGGSTSLTTSGNSNSNATSTPSTATTTTSTIIGIGDLVINEIMYNLEGGDTKREWVEIYNNSSTTITLSGANGGWRFNDGANHLLNEPPAKGSQGSLNIASGGYFILADDAEIFLTDHSGFSGTVIDTVINLKNSTSTVQIIDPNGTVIDEVTYSSAWGANGDGKTLERKTASGGSNDPANWAVSSAIGGTPGAVNNFEIAGEGGPTATSTPAIATSTIQIIGTGSGTDISATTTISENTTWTLSGSPYRLFFRQFERPTVMPNVTLTIEPGVKIIPQDSSYTPLEIKGTLNAIGTAVAPIIFTSIKDADGNASTTPQDGEWLNIVFSAGSQGNLDFVEFHYGGQGIMRPLKEMVKVVGAKININHSTFTNAQGIALRLVDADAVVENSIFSDNNCGISVDSLVSLDNGTDGGCYSDIHSQYSSVAVKVTPQIKKNQFIRNRIIAVEIRNGSIPIIDNNIFIDNQYPARIENSYPAITNSQITNSTTSPNFIGAIAISGYTQWTENFTIRKDLPYLLQTNGPAWSPRIHAGVTMTVEAGVIFKTDHTFNALNVDGNIVVSGTVEDPVIFTSVKDDSYGGDTNGDGVAGSENSPQANSPKIGDWDGVKISASGSGTFTNTNFEYGKQDYETKGPEVEELLEDFPKENLVISTMGASSKNWTAKKNGKFVKIIFHDFATVNPQHFDYLAGIKKASGDTFVASTTISGTDFHDIATKEFEVVMSGDFVKDESYYAILQVVQSEGSSAGENDVFQIGGVGGTQTVAVSFHEKGPQKTFHSAISVDTGATVVVQ
ncbi:MAG: lamin tail domain-containing protein [Candidatus Azambacteria bacterium]|nr:lamin tail domain-containing protein [Candidatus Azambacteria bacterium]